MSLVGQEIELINGGRITVDIERDLPDGGVIVVSTDGEIYTQDELNLNFRLSPGYILYQVLVDMDIVGENNYASELYENAVQSFMDEMIKSGYVAKKED